MLRRIAIALGIGLGSAACGGDDDGGGDPGGADSGSGPPSDAGPVGAWQALADLPAGPVQESAVVALDDLIYVIGGIDEVAATVNDVLIYDTARDQWSEAPDLPVPLHHANAAVVDGTIHIVGALLPNFDPIGNVWSWTPGDPGWTEGTEMPEGTERGAAAVGVVDGLIVVAGGLAGGSRNFVSTYDPASGEWEAAPELPVGRDHGTGQTVDGVFYLIGGRTGGFQGNSASVYAFTGGEWQMRSPMPTARGGIASGVVDGKIIVVGGEGNTAAASGVFPQSELYDPATDEWSALPDMLTPRHGMGAAGVGGRFYVPGGADVMAFGAVANHEVFRLTSRGSP